MCSFVYLLLLHIYSVCAYVASEPRFLGFRVDRASFPDSFFRGVKFLTLSGFGALEFRLFRVQSVAFRLA